MTKKRGEGNEGEMKFHQFAIKYLLETLAGIILGATIMGAAYQIYLSTEACWYERDRMNMGVVQVCRPPQSICTMNYRYLPPIWLTCKLSEEAK